MNLRFFTMYSRIVLSLEGVVKLSALRLVLDKYGVYMQHLENLIADDSTNSKDCEKIKRILS
jgi:hypothetical protein